MNLKCNPLPFVASMIILLGIGQTRAQSPTPTYRLVKSEQPPLVEQANEGEASALRSSKLEAEMHSLWHDIARMRYEMRYGPIPGAVELLRLRPRKEVGRVRVAKYILHAHRFRAILSFLFWCASNELKLA